jgi:hypothetical protein
MLPTEDELTGEVTTLETTDDEVSSPGVITSRGRTFEFQRQDQRQQLTILIILFESTDDASTYLSTRETQLKGQGVQVSSSDIGDEAHSIVSDETVGYEVKSGNAVVSTFGQGTLNAYREIVEGVLGRMENSQ